jgi:hypothetical protein
MKALTLHQPWAWAIVEGYKSAEPRSWTTQYRGPLAIHAGKTVDRGFLAAVMAKYQVDLSMAVTGTIVCVAMLVECVETAYAYVNRSERFWGDYSWGRWAWFLEDVKVLSEPIPCRGMQGLWTPSPEIERQIQTSIARRESGPGRARGLNG